MKLFLTLLIAFAGILLSSAARAELQRFGSLVYSEDVPNTAFLLAPINLGDSFELRRLVRDHDIKLIVTGSPGGNLYEGLQMAAIIHDNDLETYIPASWSCESSCANIFLGGHARLVAGDLGVHQFYNSNGDTQQTNLGETTATTLYTTSDIISILDEFSTPVFVYEKMFRTTDIYYFNVKEKRRLNIDASSNDFYDRVDAVDEFVSKNNSELLQLRWAKTAPQDRTVAAPANPAQTPQTSAPRSNSETFEGVDFFGSDLTQAGHRYVSQAECDRICRNNPDCAAWSYVHASQWCWPKSAVTNVSIADGVTSSVVNSSQVDQTIFDRPFIETTGIDIVGFDIFPQGLQDRSLSQCRQICQRNTSCYAFSWVAKKNWCFPKYQKGSVVNRVGVISGVWNQN
jgi:hypothetical protein